MTTPTADCHSPVHQSLAEHLDEAHAWVSKGQIEKARVVFTRAVEFDATGAALNAYGCFLWQTGYIGEAVAQFERMLALAEKTASAALRSVACNNLAAVSRESGALTAAAAWQQRSWESSLAAASPGDAPAELGCDLSNRANDAILAGEFDYAEQLLRISLEWETATGTPAGVATDWASLGVIASLRGDWLGALRHFRRAFLMHEAAGDECGAGCDLLHLGELWGALGRWRSAERWLRRAVRRLELAGATRSAMKARAMLSDAKRRAEIASFNPRLN